MRSPLGALGGAARSIRNKAPVSYAPKGRLSLATPGGDGKEAQLRAYGSVGTLFAIVARNASAVALVDWRLYRKAASGRAEDRTEVTRHWSLEVLTNPNPFMDRVKLFEATQQHGDLTGEGWWVVGRDPRSKLPLELWPVRPDRMEPVPHPTKFIAGYVYTGPDGERVPLDVTDVIRPILMPDPMDPYRGLGPVAASATDLESAQLAAQWNRNFFRNSAEPGGIIEVDKRLSDEEFDEMTTRWREQHQGVAQAHRVAVLEQGVWKDRSYSMRDMQFTELRRLSSETIREAFGFPKPMLGSTDDVNRANAEAAEVVFSRWLVVPRLERIKGALNHSYLPLFGEGWQELEFDYDDPTPQDSEAENAERDSRVSAATALIAAGFDAAATMEAFDLPEIPWTPPAPPPPTPGDEPPALGPEAEARAVQALLARLGVDRLPNGHQHAHGRHPA